ncbi:hypothetical protein chiPu_0026259, partial [Chiloscyllium punctatum]|nr:hypothetical protein [Chiloscyllium punctatum]
MWVEKVYLRSCYFISVSPAFIYRGYTSGSSQGHLANKEGSSYSDTSLQPTQIGQGEIETDKRGYRKLYEELQRKNVQLRDQLQEVQMQIAQTKLELEKAMQ